MTAVTSFIGVVGGLAVLGEVEAAGLFLVGDPDPDGLLERLHDREGHDERVHDGHAVGERLLQEQPDTAAVEDPLFELPAEERGVRRRSR
jgi:hypothetical protein